MADLITAQARDRGGWPTQQAVGGAAASGAADVAGRHGRGGGRRAGRPARRGENAAGRSACCDHVATLASRPGATTVSGGWMSIDGPAVVVEVLFLRVCGRDKGLLGYRVCRLPLTGSSSPDDRAVQACGAGGAGGAGGAVSVVHSTSWRYEPGAGVVLTYVAVPDPDPGAPAVELLTPTVVCSEDAVRPQPRDLHDHHVAAHAVRHLSELADRDPTVATAARQDGHQELWSCIRHVAGSVPTLTFSDAHAPAHPAGTAVA